MLKEELGSVLNTPEGFAETYKRYLEQLSKLNNSVVLSSEAYRVMEYLSVSDFEGKSTVFKEIINFKDVLEDGVREEVFTEELFTNCLKDIRESFDNLNLSVDSLQRQKSLLILSLFLKSRYPDFDSHVSTLKELLFNCNRELAVRNIGNPVPPRLRRAGCDFK